MKQTYQSGDIWIQGSSSGRVLIFLSCAALLLLLAIVYKRGGDTYRSTSQEAYSSVPKITFRASSATLSRMPRKPGKSVPANQPTARQVVAEKLLKFCQKRHQAVRDMASRRNVPVPDDVEKFFAALETGRWDEINAAHTALLEDPKQLNQPRSSELHDIWRPIQEAWGAARESHNWPAQRLLDYGDAILGSLKPGMIYAGGTDPGCFIATMLNETSEGEHHIVMTQNALADSTYLNYLDYLYGDQMSTLTQEDSQKSFQDYVADAQKRLEHDQQFPDEPKQVKPGEDIKVVEGTVQVSGQVGVMSINEKLFQRLMEKNPDASFAMEESFPFSSMYGNATTLGPVIELGAKDQPLTAEKAAQSVEYWRSAAEQLLADPEAPDGSDARKAYAKLVSSQAGLLAQNHFNSDAEEAFRIASQIYPASPETTFRYINLLTTLNRYSDALQVAENALKADPSSTQFQNLRDNLKQAGASRAR